MQEENRIDKFLMDGTNVKPTPSAILKTPPKLMNDKPMALTRIIQLSNIEASKHLAFLLNSVRESAFPVKKMMADGKAENNGAMMAKMPPSGAKENGKIVKMEMTAEKKSESVKNTCVNTRKLGEPEEEEVTDKFF